jgi:hypothetical protein
MEKHKSINYICGGKLGDLLHCIFVIFCEYQLSHRKGRLLLTEDAAFGSDKFGHNLYDTYQELYDIITQQSYIKSFEIYQDQRIDVNLNEFRKYKDLYKKTWLESLSLCFKVPLIETPWIQFPTINEKYKDIVLIHRSVIRHYGDFISLLEIIINNNNCLFLTSNIKEYEAFPLKHLLKVEKLSTLYEMFIAINSCKFFIGNQSSPLTIAYSINKPALIEHTEGIFYMKKHYDSFYWIDGITKTYELNGIEKYINIK